jgi:clan AA aspartic protease
MILGRVNNREAIVQIAVMDSSKQSRPIRAVVDTGYTGYLMLPRSILLDLAWQRAGFQEGILGDGSVKRFEVYLGMVIWDGVMRELEINASESEALVGMSLLDGYRIEIEAWSGGEVKLTANNSFIVQNT